MELYLSLKEKLQKTSEFLGYFKKKSFNILLIWEDFKDKVRIATVFGRSVLFFKTIPSSEKKSVDQPLHC